jgi:hypothetical protein
MRQIFILIFLLFSFFVSVYSQAKFKVVNALTKEPIKEQYCNVIKDGDTWVGIGNTDNQGIFKPEVYLDSNSTYQLWIFAEGFKPLRKDVDLFSSKLSTISIYPDGESSQKKSNLVYSTCSTIGFGDYRPKTPESLDDLPDGIKEKLVEHLISRVGNQFYSKLKLNGGQIVNLDRLYKVEANAKNYKWTPYSYYLCFSFQDTAKGIGLYTAQIVLDKNGNVVKEIQLPDISSNPEKANIISRISASVIAKKMGFTPKTDNTSLEYDADVDSLIWCFEKRTNDNGLTFSVEKLHVDAHNGKVIGASKGNGIR